MLSIKLRVAYFKHSDRMVHFSPNNNAQKPSFTQKNFSRSLDFEPVGGSDGNLLLITDLLQPTDDVTTVKAPTNAITRLDFNFLNGPTPDPFSFIFVFSNKHYNSYSK